MVLADLFGFSITDLNKLIKHLFDKYDERVSKKKITFIKELVCMHQGRIIAYQCVLANMHKNLRIASENSNMQQAQKNFENINNHEDKIREAWNLTVEKVSQYYLNFHKHGKPRMCLKAISKNNCIQDVFRETPINSIQSCHYDENTGFSKVVNSGKYYLCNDIPKDYFSGEYINPRLKTYEKTMSPKSRWDNFWKDNFDVYSSTLIIPMTLYNNSNAFDTAFKETPVGQGIEKRDIYGFLCFDHKRKDFFNTEDIELGYIIADLLSFYFIFSIEYTGYSESYMRHKKEAS